MLLFGSPIQVAYTGLLEDKGRPFVVVRVEDMKHSEIGQSSPPARHDIWASLSPASAQYLLA